LPLPAPGSVPQKAPVAWNEAKPYDGLAFRTIEVTGNAAHCILTEDPITTVERVIAVTAKKFEYSPAVINLKKGESVLLKLKSLDRQHGFNCPALGIRADINPGKETEIHLVPSKAGIYAFQCDVFCGDGHEDMTGKIIVTE
jgi:cytochrome c oxidase subunit II